MERIFLLVTGLLAAYLVVKGVDELKGLPMISYTLAFGVLLVAGLLLIIMGLEVLDSPLVIIVSTLIPLSLSLGLVWEYLPVWHLAYLLFTIIGFILIIITRLTNVGRLATILLAAVHGVAGLIIIVLPILLSVVGQTNPGFAFVGVGGALIGLGGLLLFSLKAGKSILHRETILKVLPGLLLAMTAAFVVGFASV